MFCRVDANVLLWHTGISIQTDHHVLLVTQSGCQHWGISWTVCETARLITLLQDVDHHSAVNCLVHSDSRASILFGNKTTQSCSDRPLMSWHVAGRFSVWRARDKNPGVLRGTHTGVHTCSVNHLLKSESLLITLDFCTWIAQRWNGVKDVCTDRCRRLFALDSSTGSTSTRGSSGTKHNSAYNQKPFETTQQYNLYVLWFRMHMRALVRVAKQPAHR